MSTATLEKSIEETVITPRVYFVQQPPVQFLIKEPQICQYYENFDHSWCFRIARFWAGDVQLCDRHIVWRNGSFG